MPQDITLTVLAIVGDVAMTGKNEAMRYKVGDIVGAQLSSEVATKNGDGDYILGDKGALNSPSTLYVHVTGVPNARALKMHRLMEGERVLTARGQPGGEDEGDSTIRRLHAFRISRSSIPIAARQKLIADGEITVTYAQAKKHIKRKVVSSELDASGDTEASLEDADLG